jgi:hypothetical protein
MENGPQALRYSMCLYISSNPSSPPLQNDYSKHIRELRLQEKIGKAHGKVFVKGQCDRRRIVSSMLSTNLVLNIKGVDVPLPPQPTAITCTLNNGIHYVTTPECKITPDCRIDQEFEL